MILARGLPFGSRLWRRCPGLRAGFEQRLAVLIQGLTLNPPLHDGDGDENLLF